MAKWIAEPRPGEPGNVAPRGGGGRGRAKGASQARGGAQAAGEAAPGVVGPTYADEAVRAHHERLVREVASGRLTMTLLITAPVQSMQAGVPYDMDYRNLMVGFEVLSRGHVGSPTQCQGFHIRVEPYPGNAWKFGAFEGRHDAPAPGGLISAWTVSAGGDPLMERAAAVGWRHYREHAPRPAEVPEDVEAPWTIAARGTSLKFGGQMAEAVLATMWAAVAAGRFKE